MIEENEAIEKATKFLVERYKRQPPPFKKAYMNKEGERFTLPGIDEVFIRDESYWTIFFDPLSQMVIHISPYMFLLMEE